MSASAVASMSADELKAALPIAYVLEDAGVEVEQAADGTLHAVCPFHTDTNPSFDVFGPDLERWGCYPCSLNGDVLDLIAKLHAVPDFKDQRVKAIELLQQMQGQDWTGPRKSERKQLDTDYVKTVIEGTLATTDFSLVDALLDAKSAPYTSDWLFTEFGVGQYGEWIVIPYADWRGNFLTFKHRTDTTKPHAIAGSQFQDVLYHCWADNKELPVLLCEGETDAWRAHYDLGAEYSVLALPTGAGTREGGTIGQVEPLKGRKVLLAFDGDKTGHNATRKWHSQLTKYGCTVLIVPIPDGEDVSTVPNLRSLVEMARPVLATPKGLQEKQQGYIRPPYKEDGEPIPISNWTFEPVRSLIGEGGAAFEGVVKPAGTEAVLSTFDLATKGRMVRWAAEHQGAWYGSDRDSQLLLGLLQAESPFLSVGRMAIVAGLHQGHFVWPGGKIGPEHWQYVAPTADIHLENKIRIAPGKWEPDWILTLRELHQHRIMDPILAWLAMAPLRMHPDMLEFPILAISGPAGTGKTTLIDTVIPLFSGADINLTLTNTTRHALFAYFGATNGFPVRFDEYRPGARKDTLQTLQQLLRDAYTAQPSAKGGLGDSWAEVLTVATHAPIVLSGEDVLSETSHLERIVSLNLPIEGKNRDVLREVRSWDSPNGFAYAYLLWLHEGMQLGYLPEIVNYECGPEDLHERNRKNLGVLDLGWRLLTDFLESFGITLSDPDFSMVEQEATEVLYHAPIEDALAWALEEPDATFFICRKDIDNVAYICLRLENVVQFITRQSSFVLPGGVIAVRKYLEAKYKAHFVTVEHGGGLKRMLAIQADLLNL